MRSIRPVAAFAAAILATAGLAACGDLDEDDAAADGTLKIGYVTPQTGPLAPFGEADKFVVDQMNQHFKANPLKIGNTQYSVQILVKDAQSDSKRAGDVAGELINQDKVDLVLASSTPDIVNPVADQCEANGTPCITTVAPWQPFFFGRGGTPDKAFQWTYHFFWGLEDVEQVYLNMWNALTTNKKAGAIWPNDPDGNAWGDPATGFAPVVGKSGYTITDPGHYPNGTQDFSAQISRFKAANAEILLGVPIPPDFTTFWKQAKQQGYAPKIATIGKALLFPSSVEALGAIGQNLGTEVWWHPTAPYKSSLTGQTAQQLADAYEAAGKQWTQPLGFVHALFEVAAAALTKAGGTEKAKVAGALKTLTATTIVGSLDWTKGPVPNVAKTPLAGGQWRQGTGGKYPFTLVVVDNQLAPQVPVGGKVEALP
jgi:branched-chain amino acid transport system substrate-binding protein